MKTEEQIVEYINSQEWCKSLGIGLERGENIAMLFPKMIRTYPKYLDYDWNKIFDDFNKWLNSEENDQD